MFDEMNGRNVTLVPSWQWRFSSGGAFVVCGNNKLRRTSAFMSCFGQDSKAKYIYCSHVIGVLKKLAPFYGGLGLYILDKDIFLLPKKNDYQPKTFFKRMLDLSVGNFAWDLVNDWKGFLKPGKIPREQPIDLLTKFHSLNLCY